MNTATFTGYDLIDQDASPSVRTIHTRSLVATTGPGHERTQRQSALFNRRRTVLRM